MINLIFVTLFFLTSILSPVQDNQILPAERLFTGRDNIENLKQSISLLESQSLRDPSNYEVLWRLAKYEYYLAEPEKDEVKKSKLLEAGIEAAKKAVALDGKRVEGHFWLGANYGGYADLKGALKSLGLVRSIRKQFDIALKIDPAYENGAAYLALGEMYLRLPGIFGGNEQLGVEMLEKGLKIGASNSDLMLALAERYARSGKKEEARKLFEKVLSVNDPLKTSLEQEELRRKARRQLDRLKKG